LSNSKSKSRICAVIPFYNEEKFIRNVVLETLKFVDLVIAVNDGSNDDAENLINDIKNVIILSSAQHRGKGYALQLGFIESLKRNIDIVITLDGDNQHNPEFIPSFITAINKYDIVVGNRLGNLKKMPFLRIMSNKISSMLLSLKTKQKIFDSQCGFRAYRNDVLSRIKTSSEGFIAESEILILASRLNYKIGFVDIPTVYENESSKINSKEVIVDFLKILFR
jgi:glycosyltransferase involved in cell wall biosynthesis